MLEVNKADRVNKNRIECSFMFLLFGIINLGLFIQYLLKVFLVSWLCFIIINLGYGK